MTTGDWDFSNMNWLLDDGQYVSAPTSLKCANSDEPFVFIKTSIVPITSVKEGRVITRCRISHNCENMRLAIFRYQDEDNYYFVMIDARNHDALVYRRKLGVETKLDEGSHGEVKDDEWIKLRVTWWNDYVGLAIRVEVWYGDEWVKVVDAYDTENYWKDEGGRVGFKPDVSQPAYPTWFDDTEIYGVV